MSAIAEALRAQAAALVAIADALDTPVPASSPRWYTRRALPPGCPSWRSARETAARLGVMTSKPGRELLIDASDFDAKIAGSKKSPTLASSDEKALEALGCVVPLRAVGGRR
jgi:hypothetical protein